ncbi:hypothetical protein H7U32_01525 [Bifidobacterium pullorum subsp. saeculare]|uniref:Pyrrolidone-carboxylate peptidase n=1 Tax=Bifidobacterium pullorum subsp. saeculare TaxID=78257 RepID=A0A938WYK1_9BIFI|nr:hypothetical protein [Bifidobacterium pullorum]MBM6699027.1 hypothetical protein [Bifidobacterium pullorum subsp. saeculare]
MTLAFEAVRLLPDVIAGADIVKLEISTAYARSAEALETAIVAHRPDVVICVGQAGGRSCVTVEQVAINLAERRFPGVRAGFIHVPYEPGQAVGKPDGTPSMPLEAIARSLEAAIGAAVRDDGAEPRAAMGTTH